MQLATETLNSPETTKYLVIGVASFMTVVLGLRFAFAYRRNRRLAESMGGFTPTEAKLSRGHAVVIVAVLLISMGLAIGSVLSTTVRDALASAGEQGRTITMAAIPLALGYVLWLRWAVHRASEERAELNGQA